MANWYVSSVAHAAVAQFAINTAYSLGQYVRQLAAPAFGSERVFKVTTAGTSAGAEPSWNLTNNATTASGTAVFTNVTGQEAEQLAGNWRAPFATCAGADSGIPAGVANIFVSNDHTETRAAAQTFGTSATRQWQSTSRTGATLPPQDTDYVAGAAVATSGANNLALGGLAAWKGFTFTAGSGASTASLTVGVSTGSATIPTVRLENCALILGNTSTSSRIQFGAPGFALSAVFLRDVSLQFGATGQSISYTGGLGTTLIWDGGAVAATGSVPTSLFNSWNAIRCSIQNVDFSACSGSFFTAGVLPVGQSDVFNCKLHASAAFPAAATTLAPGDYLHFTNNDDSTSGKNYRFKNYDAGLTTINDAVVVRSGGAGDGVVTYSHKYGTVNIAVGSASSATFQNPGTGQWMVARNTLTGSAKTLTVHLIAFTSAIPSNLNLWMESAFLETSGVPLGTGYSTRAKIGTDAGVALTATTEDWTAGSVAARANSTAYSVGDYIKLASNPGRVFICTTAGTSAGSEPGGYASAVDGGSVTDGTAAFRAGWRLKLTQAFTPQVVGFLRARIMHALATGLTFHVDPKLLVS